MSLGNEKEDMQSNYSFQTSFTVKTRTVQYTADARINDLDVRTIYLYTNINSMSMHWRSGYETIYEWADWV